MNLGQLKYALAVAETSSFSRASERCFVTQPSLSNAISQLEEEFGGRLFHRTTHSVSLTPFGERMLPHIAAVLDALSELERTAKDLVEPAQKLIRIGFSPLVDLQLLAAVLEPFKLANKEVEIVMKECFLGELRDRLAQHKIDVLFVPEGFEMRFAGKATFYSDDMCFIPRSGSGYDQAGPSVKLEDVSDEVFTITGEGCGLAIALREIFRASGYEFRQYAGQAVNYSVLEDWASLGIGSTILPRSKISKKNSAARPLLLKNGDPASVKFETVWNKRSPQPAHIKELLQYFRKLAPEYLKGLRSG
jgi:DNA-binding transcriptional LysR family regulator